MYSVVEMPKGKDWRSISLVMRTLRMLGAINYTYCPQQAAYLVHSDGQIDLSEVEKVGGIVYEVH